MFRIPRFGPIHGLAFSICHLHGHIFQGNIWWDRCLPDHHRGGWSMLSMLKLTNQWQVNSMSSTSKLFTRLSRRTTGRSALDPGRWQEKNIRIEGPCPWNRWSQGSPSDIILNGHGTDFRKLPRISVNAKCLEVNQKKGKGSLAMICCDCLIVLTGYFTANSQPL